MRRRTLISCIRNPHYNNSKGVWTISFWTDKRPVVFRIHVPANTNVIDEVRFVFAEAHNKIKETLAKEERGEV